MLGRAREIAATLARARPTAVNLFWALDRMVARARARPRGGRRRADADVAALLEEAHAIREEDRAGLPPHRRARRRAASPTARPS